MITPNSYAGPRQIIKDPFLREKIDLIQPKFNNSYNTRKVK